MRYLYVLGGNNVSYLEVFGVSTLFYLYPSIELRRIRDNYFSSVYSGISDYSCCIGFEVVSKMGINFDGPNCLFDVFDYVFREHRFLCYEKILLNCFSDSFDYDKFLDVLHGFYRRIYDRGCVYDDLCYSECFTNFLTSRVSNFHFQNEEYLFGIKISVRVLENLINRLCNSLDNF